MSNTVTLNYDYYPDPTKGRPVFNGSIYVGEPDTDPTLAINQKDVSIVQENGTVVPVAQPVNTGAGGVPLYNGSPVTITTNGNYSLAVLNNQGSQVYYFANSSIVESSTTVYPKDFGAVGGGVDDTAALQAAIDYAETLSTEDDRNDVVQRNVTLDLGGVLYSISDELTFTKALHVTAGQFVALNTFSSTSGYMVTIADTAEGMVWDNVEWDGGTNPVTYQHYADNCVQNNARSFTYNNPHIIHFNNVGLDMEESGRCHVNGGTIHKHVFKDWFSGTGALAGASAQDWQYITGSTGLRVADADGIFNGVISFLSEVPIEASGSNNLFNSCHPWNYAALVNIPAKYYVLKDLSGFGNSYTGCYFDTGTIYIQDDTGNGFSCLFDGCIYPTVGAGTGFRFELHTTVAGSNASGLNITGGLFSGSTTNLIEYTTSGAGTWNTLKRVTWGFNTKNGGGVVGDMINVNGSFKVSDDELVLGGGSGEPYLKLDGAAGSEKYFECLSGGVMRWQFGNDTASETGSDAGANFAIQSYDDAGVFLKKVLRINRADGLMSYEGDIRPRDDSAYSLGNENLSWAGVFTDGLSLTESASTPTAIAGKTQLFADNSGNLKYITGAGVVKTITAV